MAIISVNDKGTLSVPDVVDIPFIEGDGIGGDITEAMRHVVDQVVHHTYKGKKSIEWIEVPAGEKAQSTDGHPLPQSSLDNLKKHVVSIKGPLGTPIGSGIRSLNVAIRQSLDLFACVRPVRYFEGVSSPLKRPQDTDMVIFRENTEDIYAGIEWEAKSNEAAKIIRFLESDMKTDRIRFPKTSAIGIKPVSIEGSKRLVRKAVEFAIAHNRRSISLVHKGNIMKFTEGGFCKWGYEVIREEYGGKVAEDGYTYLPSANGNLIKVQDVIADNCLQKVLLTPKDFDVIATMNLNGDYLSDALAAQVGGIGIAPGANLSDEAAVFEATHGTAPRHAGKQTANPSSLLLSADMMLRHMGWIEAADSMVKGMAQSFAEKCFTQDLSRDVPNSKTLGTLEFAKRVVALATKG